MAKSPQKPKLGQHFLVDPAACRAIADALGDLSQQTVVEIGPGSGAITEILAQRARQLIAIELDRDLASRLRGAFADRPSVQVIEADVLTVDFDALRSGDQRLFVVGNLPYYITSDILLRLFRFHRSIARAVVMMQREVADRIAAAPGTRDYGMLSVTAQLYARIERILTLPPQAFMPPPEVSSTALRLTMQPRFEELGIADPDRFTAFLRRCFAQKRKTLTKNLRAAGVERDLIVGAMERAGVGELARAEELKLESLARLWTEWERIAPAP